MNIMCILVINYVVVNLPKLLLQLVLILADNFSTLGSFALMLG